MTAGAALLIQEPDGSLREAPLPAGRAILGRAPECDIVIEGRLNARQHAAIARSGAAYILEDLGSHNGTTVNGQALNGRRALRHGDRIELGGMGWLMFVDGDATSTRPQAPSAGVWLDASTQDVWVDGRRLSPPLSPAQFSLLQALSARVDHVCSRAEIVAAVWPGASDGISDEAIDALIKRVRARLAESPGGQRYLTTLRGRGLLLHSSAERPPER
jgi:DNA-binding response OmpR family regulator